MKRLPSLLAAMLAAGLALAGCDRREIVVAPAEPDTSYGRGALYGLVADMDGAAIEGAQVVTDPVTRTVFTDASGTFVLNDVPAPRAYRVTVSKPRFVPASRLVGLSDGEATAIYATLLPTDTLRLVRSSSTTGGSSDLVVLDSLAYVASQSRLEIRDLHAATFGALVGSAAAQSSYDRALTVALGHAYYCGYFGSLDVYDVSAPAAPVLVRSVPLGGQAHDAEVDGTLLVVAADDSLMIFDLANPGQPVRRGRVATVQDGLGQGNYGVALDRTRKLAFLASFNNGVEVVDYSDPDAPAYRGRVEGGGNPRKLVYDAARARLVVAGDGAATIFDASGGSDLQLLSSYTPFGNGGRDVAVDGDRVVWASSFNGLSLVDFSDLQRPRLLDRMASDQTLGAPGGVVLSSGYLTLAAGTRLSVVQLPPPAPTLSPMRVVGRVPTSALRSGAAVAALRRPVVAAR